jgi:hypothetical protein
MGQNMGFHTVALSLRGAYPQKRLTEQYADGTTRTAVLRGLQGCQVTWAGHQIVGCSQDEASALPGQTTGISVVGHRCGPVYENGTQKRPMLRPTATAGLGNPSSVL